MRSRIVKYAPQILLALLLSVATTGCFVLDELNGGKALDVPKPKPKQGGKSDGSNFSQMFESGSEVLGEIKVKVADAMKPAPDPDNTIIRCQVEGRVQFKRKYDCQVIGGIVMR